MECGRSLGLGCPSVCPSMCHCSRRFPKVRVVCTFALKRQQAWQVEMFFTFTQVASEKSWNIYIYIYIPSFSDRVSGAKRATTRRRLGAKRTLSSRLVKHPGSDTWIKWPLITCWVSRASWSHVFDEGQQTIIKSRFTNVELRVDLSLADHT